MLSKALLKLNSHHKVEDVHRIHDGRETLRCFGGIALDRYGGQHKYMWTQCTSCKSFECDQMDKMHKLNPLYDVDRTGSTHAHSAACTH